MSVERGGGGGGAVVLQRLLVMCRWRDVNVSFYLGFEHGEAQGPVQVCVCVWVGDES